MEPIDIQGIEIFAAGYLLDTLVLRFKTRAGMGVAQCDFPLQIDGRRWSFS
jgi:hypothetical protein